MQGIFAQLPEIKNYCIMKYSARAGYILMMRSDDMENNNIKKQNIEKYSNEAGADDKNSEKRPTMLLHSCCGPCSTAVIERLIERYDLTVFFYNPNITNEGEYEKRLETQKKFIDAYNADMADGCRTSVRLIEGEYDPENYAEAVRGLEDEPENGARCTKCFEIRMKKTAMEAERLGFDSFATTLSVSPHKNTQRINNIGYELEKEFAPAFLDESFKKKDGFKRSTELSREYGLYRQNFCGCVFSERPGAGAEDPSRERGRID